MKGFGMHAFPDTQGRTWTIQINVTAIKKVRALLNLDLFKLIEDGLKPLSQLLADPVQLTDVLYCLCQEAAQALQISDEDFGRAMGGDALLHASEAFVEELIDFFPDARTRASLKQVLAAGRTMREKILDHAGILLQQIDPEAEAKRWIASFGNSPALSESTPDRSP